MKTSGNNGYGIRFYDSKNANEKGRYLFPSFTNNTNRQGLALLPEWNEMTHIKQWKVEPGSTIITGKVALQYDKNGREYLGGEEQWYILDLNHLK